MCGAGSDELITLLTRAYAGPGEEVLYSEYGFLMYPISALGVGAKPVAASEKALRADVKALLAGLSDKTRILFLANPNNPTGSFLAKDEVQHLVAGLPKDVLLVIDAAYAEYVTRNDYSAGAELVDAHDNVVMTRTFSKIYGLAGVRLGWAYCPPAVADVLNRLRNPFNVTAPAQAAALAALEDIAHVDAARANNDIWLPWVSAELERIGLKVAPSRRQFRAGALPPGTAAAMPTRPTASSPGTASSRARWAPTSCRTACASPSGARTRCASSSPPSPSSWAPSHVARTPLRAHRPHRHRARRLLGRAPGEARRPG